MFRAIWPEGGNHQGTSECQEPGCGKTTREGKPFCPSHVENSPYIQYVMDELEKREIEVKLLRKNKPLDKDAHLIRETILLLRRKPFTLRALASQLDISRTAADRLIDQVCDLGFAVKGATQRGEKNISGRQLEPKDEPDEKNAHR